MRCGGLANSGIQTASRVSSLPFCLQAKAAKPKAARPSSAEGAKKRPASAEGPKRKAIKLEEKPAAAGSGAKGAAGEKKVRVKKEYELPGQTRETPDEVGQGAGVLYAVLIAS